MKRIFLSLALHFIAIICICQSPYDFYQDYLTLKQGHLKGKVKSVESYKYEIINKNGEIQKGRRVADDKKFFNEGGLIQKEGNTSFYYDTLGRLLKSITSSEYGESVLYYIHYEDGILATRGFITEEDRRERLGVRTILNTDGYDSVLIQTGIFRTEKEVTTCEYDKQGNPVKETNIIYETDGTTQKKINWVQSSTNKYDKNNNLIEAIISKKDYRGPIYVSINPGESGDGRSVTYSKNHSEPLKVSITYNKYDKNMNWTKVTKYIDGVPTSITERIITYF